MKQQQSRNNYSWIFGHSVISMFFVALLLCTFSSCKDDNGLDKIEEQTVTFSLDLSKGFSPGTYALTNNDEDKVATIDVLVFDNNGKFFSGPHYGLISGTDVTVSLPDNVGDEFTISVFGNGRAEVNAAIGNINNTTVKADALKEIVYSHTGKWNSTAGSEDYKSIPMYGELKKSQLAGTGVPMTRAMARIGVSLTGSSTSSFELSQVYLVNYNTKGYIANVSTDSNVKIPASARSNGLTDALAYTATNATSSSRDIYLFEADAAAGAIETNPCIIIYGTYKGAYGDFECYYRIDFTDQAGTYLPIRRNHTYDVMISSVTNPGFSNIEDAFQFPGSNVNPNLTYMISSWSSSSLGNADCAGAGESTIEVSADELTFDSAERTKDNGDNILFIQTDYVDGWQVESIVDPGNGQDANWLSLLSMDGTPVTTCADLSSSLYPFQLSTPSPIKLKMSANNGGSPRTALINIKAGATVYPVKVVQSNVATVYNEYQPEADSYTFFVPPFDDVDRIYIPVSRANAGNTIKLSSTDVFTAELSSGSTNTVKKVEVMGVGSNGYVYVELGTVAGNAEVSIKKNGEIDPIYTWDITVIEPVIESRKANSYIVAPNSGILLPVGIANDSDLGPQLTSNDAYAVELVWMDNLKGISTESTIWSISPYGTGDTGQVLVGTGKEAGNAVVGIRKKNASGQPEGGFLWSWHIWVTDYNPDKNSPASGYFMDRNLGALNNGFVNNQIGGTLISDATERSKSMGLLYQWGRKDPFPTSTTGFNSTVTPYFGNPSYGDAGTQKILNVSSISTSTYLRVPGSSTDNNLGFAVSNPHIFYFNGSNTSDWYATSTANQNAKLWGGDDNTSTNTQSKTVYDPCPPGWRVPSLSDWTVALNGKTDYMNSDPDLGNGIDPSTGGWNWQTNGMIAAEGGSWVDNQIANTFFPASGFRTTYSGGLLSVGSNGYCWSASSINNDDLVRNLSFDSSFLNSPGNDGYSRAAAYSVRCSKE